MADWDSYIRHTLYPGLLALLDPSFSLETAIVPGLHLSMARES